MTDPAPIVDDELTVTVRIHVCATDVRDRMAREVLKLLPNIAAGLQPLMDPDGEDAYLAGIDVSVPDFRPIGAPGKITHEFSPAWPHDFSPPEEAR